MNLKIKLFFFREKTLLLLFVLLSTDFARENIKDSKYFEQFQKFMIKYNKTYQSEKELEKKI